MIRLFQILIPVAHLVLIFLDFIILGGLFVLASILTMDVPDLGIYLFYENGLTRIAPVLIIMMFGWYFEDLYSRIYIYSRIYLAQQVLVVVGATLLAQSLIYYVAPASALEPSTAFLAMGMIVVVFPLWRLFYSSFLLERTAESILVVGHSPVVHEMVEHLQKQPELNLRILGY
ncbi:MAG: hypothetical protein FJW40_08310 [Acidobacteria bacterium]|nr:hypothetical protein [Acidobacteriota bacterium]